ncbi:MAG: polysaccharide biosynthesis tyrosine autokinase [Sphingopyxis sp.]|nr:polysaccharide biosynthesis tyrosine autokinase [Sphingopyxis sp.]
MTSDTDLGIKPEAGFSINFAQLWAAVYRSRFIAAGILIGCLAIGIAITFLTTPIYRAQTTIQIDQEAAKVLGTEQTDSSASIQDAERFLETQIGIMQSRSVALSVVRDLRLTADDRFLLSMDVDPQQAADSELPLAEARQDLVLKTLAENLTVSLPRVSRLATISFDSPDAALSARIANAFAENFIRNNLQRKFEASAYAREFLSDQLKQAQERLEESERAAVNFARETGIIDASKGISRGGEDSAQSLTTSTLVQLNQAHAEALAKRSQAERKWQAVSAAPVLSLPEVITNPAVQQLSVMRADLQARVEEEQERRTGEHPAVRQLQQRLQEIENQQMAVARRIRDSVKTERDIAASQETAIKRQVDQFKGSTLTEQTQAVQLSILRREANTSRQQYEALLQRFNQLNAEAGVQSNNVSVVDKAALPPEPTWPKLPLNLALALFMGISLSAATILAREQLFAKLISPDDIKDRLGLPVLGAIPLWHSDKSLVELLADPKSDVSEAYNSVRSSLSLSSGSGLPRSIAFVSTQASEGKSSACLATALSVSKLKKNCVMVDLDLRRPNLHRLLSMSNNVGASNILAGETAVAAAVQPTKFPGLSIITGGPVPPNPAELLTDENITGLLEELAKIYDVIFVDSAPILALADAIMVNNNCEATVYIVEAGRNSPNAVLRAVSRLQESRSKIVGVILSRFDAGRMGYGYEYAYGYAYESRDT